MENTIAIPVSELEALRRHTEGVKMPAAAAAVIQNLAAHIPTPPIEIAIANLQRALQEVRHRSPEHYLANILSSIAAIQRGEAKASNLANIALCATQWAFLHDGGRDPYTNVPREARIRYAGESSTIFDLTIGAGNAAMCTNLEWDPCPALIALAGQALAWSAKEAEAAE
jgi:hypothetical protein